MRRILNALGDLLLTALAAVGTLCILATAAALVGGVSLIMFSTGSMSPTIAAGSVALVRPVAAADVRVGDIVTVERNGRLPVTHRVRAIGPSSGALRVLTLRGDANDADDLETYRVASVRLVMFSVPGTATVVASLGRPAVLGGITAAATLLVLWAFWPRSGRARVERAPRRLQRAPSRAVQVPRRAGLPDTTAALAAKAPPRRAGVGPIHAGHLPKRVAGLAIGFVLLGLACSLPSAPPAQAQTVERVIRGRVITLVSVGDHAAMAQLTPGRPVAWQVGVMSDPVEPGQIDLSLRTAGVPRAQGIVLRVDRCAERWRDDACESGAQRVLDEGPASRFLDDPFDLGRLATGSQRWLLISAWLPADRPTASGAGARVTVTATGFGERVSDDSGELPQTGSTAARGLLVAALAATLAGVAIVLRRSNA